MKLNELKWMHPCGCGDTPDLRAEAKTAAGQFRIKKVGEEYFVQRFSPAGVALSKGADGVPLYEAIAAEALEALLV